MTENLSLEYFRNLINSETVNLEELYKKWMQEKNDPDLNEDIIGEINVAAGQADLLIQERFDQFRSLIDDCEFKRGEREVTLQDLEGFWDIIYIQVLNIKSKFDALDDLKENNWESPMKINVADIKRRKPLVAKNIQVKKKPAVGKSKLREHILAERKKMIMQKIQTQTTEDSCMKKIHKDCGVRVRSCSNEKTQFQVKSEDRKKSFNAGFFKIETPVKPCSTSLKREFSLVAGSPKVLSSTVLREQMKTTPHQHKDYSPCMRVTRSMKKTKLQRIG